MGPLTWCRGIEEEVVSVRSLEGLWGVGCAHKLGELVGVSGLLKCLKSG